MIPYGKQDINQQDIDSVVDVLKSEFLTQGPIVPHFEESVAKYVGVKFGVATNSATSALHIACLSLGVTEGDVVWTSPISFVASANCALYCDAKIDFVDIDPQTFNISVSKLSEKLAEAKRLNQPLPKVVIPVHFAGQSCEMKAIYILSQEYGFRIIEDASHAIGGSYQDKKIGCCEFSDICIFSFHPVKIITTAEGGLAVTNNSELASMMNLFRSHGVTRSSELMITSHNEPWYYEQVSLGFNYRMTELQAALGISQLARIDYFIEKRRAFAGRYIELLSLSNLDLPQYDIKTESSWHLFVIKVKNTKRLSYFEQLRSRNIGVNVHYIPIYKQPYYENLGFSSNYCPNAESYYERCISIPLYHSMTEEQQDTVISTLLEVSS